MATEVAPLLCEVEAGVATLTLNRPSVLNALNLALKAELAERIAELGKRRDVRAIVLTGSGRAFCSGGDIREMDPGRTPADTRERLLALHRTLFTPLATIEKPVIAAVNGTAVGAGLSLALACDLIFAAERAVFGAVFSSRGLVPDAGAAFRLVRYVGVARAKELAFSGRLFGAGEALQLGLVQRVVADDHLLRETQAYAASLASGATVALGLTKRLLDLAPTSTRDEMVEHEIGAVIQAIGTGDHAEALSAFAEKRKPSFTGR
jgi:2-(1,2-epoxy-1,2-dihydrophenyl)acetyl-CoA isomerase